MSLKIPPENRVHLKYALWWSEITQPPQLPLMIHMLIKYIYWVFYDYEYFRNYSSNLQSIMQKTSITIKVSSIVKYIQNWRPASIVENNYLSWSKFRQHHYAVGNREIESIRPSITQWTFILGGNGNYLRYGGTTIGIISNTTNDYDLETDPWQTYYPNYLIQADGIAERNLGFTSAITQRGYPFKKGDQVVFVLDTYLKVIRVKVNSCPMVTVATNIYVSKDTKYRMAVGLRNLYMWIKLSDFSTKDIN